MGNAYRSVLALKPTGDAAPANVLAGKTFSNADGTGKTGTMVNNGAVSITLTDQDPTYTIPEGYHNGLGVVNFTSSGGDGADLVVTCSDYFAGETITCSDGTTTYTETCPSSSPYIVTFKSIPTGTWTVSAEISGVTYSESVLIQNFDAELTTYIKVNVDFYSAANDTVSYIDVVDGQTHTIVTDSTGHANAQITINNIGSSITFTSSVAKDPNNLSNAYSKAIALSLSTTSVYLMPDNVMYWYGYIGSDAEEMTTANGWTLNIPSKSPTYETNYLQMASGSNDLVGIGSKGTVDGSSAKMIYQGSAQVSGVYSYIVARTNKNATVTAATQTSVSDTNLALWSVALSNGQYIETHTNSGRNGKLYAFWYE